MKLKDILFRIRLDIRIRINSWWMNRQFKRIGIFIGKDYKTISEAIDAGKRFIIIPKE